MSLEQWLKNAWVRRISPSHVEVANLIGVADRFIADGSLDGISPDGAFINAYHAARALCQAALHAAGYEVPRKGGFEHQRTLESIKYTLDGDWSERANYLTMCSRRRSQGLYDQTGIAQPRDAEELLNIAKQLRESVLGWLRERHPHLLP